MAQIMNYHKHPISRTVTIPGYTTNSNRLKINPVTGSTTYDWDNMTDTYFYYYFIPSVENDAVAVLMYHCGVSVKMDYNLFSNGGSAAYSETVPFALNAYFGYDAGISQLRRADYQYTEWIELLKAEIRAGRPVYYAGWNGKSGHAFVCDGYDINDLFHFNWGWEGVWDGYFEVSALINGYNLDQTIVAGLQPGGGQLRRRL
jgi:hypothetical protein